LASSAVTDWALAEFREHYGKQGISKWDIFHYTYGLLHHPEYRTRYAANLKRELPRIPMAPEFRRIAEIGAALMKLHIDYEKQAEYPLERRETGKLNWHYQTVHHDLWDYDNPPAPILLTVKTGATSRDVVVQLTKMGLVFVLDRDTGQPIFPVAEVPVPRSDVPGEQTSPTQPFPVKPEPLTQMTISRDHLYKGEPQHQSYCERMVDDNHIKLGGPYMPIALNGYSISPPGPQGGINFWGGSYDPKLHLFVSNTTNLFQPMRLVQKPDGSYINEGPLAGLRRFGDADRHLPCGPTPWGELVAVNMDTGDIAYRKTLGVTDAFPEGLRDTGRPSTGGVILTASGLTFVGGTDDFRFRAFATATGEKLWEIKLPSSIEATPVTYLGADGRQFVTVVSTGGSLTGSDVTSDEIIAFAVPKK
jgi:quinoprotein glucose dehydrogenase